MCVNCQSSGFHQEGDELDSSSLVADSWADWAPAQITDGVIDIHVEGSLQGLAREHATKVLGDVDGIIGTPIRFVDTPSADIDIKIGIRDSLEGIGVADAAGVAHIDENGVTNVLIRSDWVLETDKQITPKKARRRARRIAKGKEVKPLKQVLQAVSKRIITHEVLHSFGLSHPDNDGFNSAWDTNDSTLSYNIVGDWEYGINSAITGLDAAALQSVWGVG